MVSTTFPCSLAQTPLPEGYPEKNISSLGKGRQGCTQIQTGVPGWQGPCLQSVAGLERLTSVGSGADRLREGPWALQGWTTFRLFHFL